MRYAEGVEEGELSEKLREKLQMAEIFSRREFLITSGFREGDDRCHGVGDAVDIACVDSTDRLPIVRGLIRAGIGRIGVYTTHIHADVCEAENGFPENVLWLGGASK